MNIDLYSNPIKQKVGHAPARQWSKRKTEWSRIKAVTPGPVTDTEARRIRERKGVRQPIGAVNLRRELAAYQIVKDLLCIRPAPTVAQIQSRCANHKGLGARNVSVIVSALLS